MSLLRRIKCGLQNIQFNNELLNLSNSNWLAENLRKAIHEQTGNFISYIILSVRVEPSGDTVLKP